jgi:cytosine/adenosine deaminase-related metal-dependent hydrolase
VLLPRIGWEGQVCDLEIADGRLASAMPAKSAAGLAEPEWTALVPLRNWHCHLDKSLIGERWVSRSPGRSVRAIATAEPGLRHGLARSGADRATDLLQAMAAAGTAAVRSHVDIGPAYGLTNLTDVQSACHRLDGIVECELVAFPQQGLRGRGAVALMAEALQAGAQIVGGLDPGGFDGDIEGGLDVLFTLAGDADAPIDIHLHDLGESGLRTIRRLAELTVQAGWQGRVAVSHALVLGELDVRTLAEVAELLVRAGIQVITGVVPESPVPPVDQLLRAGVAVRIGSDNVADLWSPFGSPDVLVKARALAERSGWAEDQRLALAAGLAQRGSRLPKPGEPADLLLVRVRNSAEAVARCPASRLLLLGGLPAAGCGGGPAQWQRWTGTAPDGVIAGQDDYPADPVRGDVRAGKSVRQ